MDLAKQTKELEVIIGRAKRAGLTVHHYAENGLAILRIPPPKPVVATDAPPAAVPPIVPPQAQG
jgi:hypothetical protein